MEQINNIILITFCKKCKKEFPLIDEFWPIKKNGDFNKLCILCNDENKDYRKKNKEKARQRSSEWRKEHPDAYREYRNKNRDHVNKLKRESRERNKERINTKERQKRKDNPETYKKYADNAKESHNRWAREKRKNDPNFRLRKNIGRSLRNFLKQNNDIKNLKTPYYLGCSIEFLKIHLESKFTEGMNWSNYGKLGWHIDHIIPCNAFILTNQEEKLICFNWVNLQPLWYYENSIKNDLMPNGKYVGDCNKEEINFYINDLKNKVNSVNLSN